MDLKPEQMDALVELINIAFGRAAASLSTLTGQRVLLDVPRVVVQPIDKLYEALDNLVDTDLATVHQIFTGPVAGDALLLLGDRIRLGRSDPDRQIPVAIGLLQQQDRLILRLVDLDADHTNFAHLCPPSVYDAP